MSQRAQISSSTAPEEESSCIRLLESRIKILSELIDPLFDGSQSAFDRVNRLLSLSDVSERQEESSSESTLLQVLVTETQKNWLRRSETRWGPQETKEDNTSLSDKVTGIKFELAKLGFMNAVAPQKTDSQYQWGIVFGGSIPAIFKRLDYLLHLIKENRESESLIADNFEIFLLGSQNSSTPYLDNLPGLVKCFPDKFYQLKNKGGGLPEPTTKEAIAQWVDDLKAEGVFPKQATESQVILWLTNQIEWPQGVTFTLIDTPFQPVVGSHKLRAPKSEDQLRCLLETLNSREHWPQGPMLAVTNNPYVQRQALLNTLTIFFSLLKGKIFPVVVPVGCSVDEYAVEIAEYIQTGNHVGIKGLLDECARYLFQLKGYLEVQAQEVEEIKKAVEKHDHIAQALLSEISGYIHLGHGEYEKARQFYQEALEHVTSEEPAGQLSERLSDKVAKVNQILEKSQTVNAAGFFTGSRGEQAQPEPLAAEHQSVASMG